MLPIKLETGRVISAACVLSTILFLSLPSVTYAATYTMRISHAAAVGDPRDFGAKEIAKILNAKNSCDLAVQVYPDSQLGGSTTIVEQVQQGYIQAAIMPSSYLVGTAPIFGLMDLPYFLPQDEKALLKLYQSQPMKEFLGEATKKGIIALDIWNSGYMQWASNKPLLSPEDYKGVVVRVMPSKVLIESAKIMGMQPVTMNVTDLYQALQSGAVQAEANPINTQADMKFYEVAKTISMTSHGALNEVFMVSKAWWDSVPQSCQTEIQDAVKRGGDTNNTSIDTINARDAEMMKKFGVTFVYPTADQNAALADVVRDKAEAYFVGQVGDQGQKYIDAFNNEVKLLTAENAKN